MNTNAKKTTNATKPTESTKRPNPLDRLDTTVTAAQLFAHRLKDMADEIIYQTHQIEFSKPHAEQIDALVQAIVNVTGKTNGAVVEALQDAYQGGGR